MRKTILGFLGISFLSFGMVMGYQPDPQGCCSAYGRLDFCAPDGVVVCEGGKASESCSCTFDERTLCDGRKDTGGNLSSFFGDSLSPYERFIRTRNNFMATPQVIRADAPRLGLSEKKIRSEIAFASWLARGGLCKQIETLSFFVGENYLYAGNPSNSSSQNYYPRDAKLVKYYDLVEKGENSASKDLYDEAIAYYQDALKVLGGSKKVPYEDLRFDVKRRIQELEQRQLDYNRELQEYAAAKDLFYEAERLEQRGDYEGAYDTYGKFLQLPSRVLYALGNDYENKAIKNLNEMGRLLMIQDAKRNDLLSSLQPEALQAKKALGEKSKILESLVPVIKAKDYKTQENVKNLLKTFKLSKDSYTRNIGIYLSYLLI